MNPCKSKTYIQFKSIYNKKFNQKGYRRFTYYQYYKKKKRVKLFHV